jgi:hypothetical protein
MTLSALAMPAFDNETSKASHVPLPKINVPPPREQERVLQDESEKRPERAAVTAVSTPVRAGSSTSIRWDARFAVSLIVLLVLVNMSLVILFAKPATHEKGFVTELAPSVASKDNAPGLNRLAPAANGQNAVTTGRPTTTYISTTERRALLEQLRRTPQPGVVSVPPMRAVPANP